MLGLAVTATLAANVGYGLPHGLPGALLSGWPAVAFIGCAEMTISAVRRMRPSAGGGMVPAPVPTDAENAALMALRATITAGNPLSQNQLMERFGLTRAQATKVRQRVTAESNGSEPEA